VERDLNLFWSAGSGSAYGLRFRIQIGKKNLRKRKFFEIYGTVGYGTYGISFEVVDVPFLMASASGFS
jgi:hypothetical protein